MVNANQLIGTHDVLFMTLDTLRYDVAQRCFEDGRTPNFARVLPNTGWEKRHSPGSFTYAAHQAFFAGFLPTPATPGLHPRLFALRFPGSETTADTTCVFDSADIVTGLHGRGYHTVCIGGVGFFNKLTPLGRALPGLFDESHWSTELGVTNQASAAHQFSLAVKILGQRHSSERVFLFINISAIHQPNRFYLPGPGADSIDSHAAALEYVDSQLPMLFQALERRAPAFCIVCSDHGTAYGEDGFVGHRFAHPVVWEVPYAHFILGSAS